MPRREPGTIAPELVNVLAGPHEPGRSTGQRQPVLGYPSWRMLVAPSAGAELVNEGAGHQLKLNFIITADNIKLSAVKIMPKIV